MQNIAVSIVICLLHAQTDILWFITLFESRQNKTTLLSRGAGRGGRGERVTEGGKTSNFGLA